MYILEQHNIYWFGNLVSWYSDIIVYWYPCIRILGIWYSGVEISKSLVFCNLVYLYPGLLVLKMSILESGILVSLYYSDRLNILQFYVSGDIPLEYPYNSVYLVIFHLNILILFLVSGDIPLGYPYNFETEYFSFSNLNNPLGYPWLPDSFLSVYCLYHRLDMCPAI